VPALRFMRAVEGPGHRPNPPRDVIGRVGAGFSLAMLKDLRGKLWPARTPERIAVLRVELKLSPQPVDTSAGNRRA
jgi:hypothetical protein